MSFKLDKPAMFSVDGYKRHSKDVNNKQNIIASGDITMEDVDFPVHGVDNLGNEKIMEPGKDYSFPGDIVLETPLKKNNMGYGKKHDSSHKKYEDTSFKMKGFPMIDGTVSHLKQKKDIELQGRWKGMTLSEFDKTLAKERDSYINSEPKPTAEEIKAFDKRHAENRRKAQGL